MMIRPSPQNPLNDGADTAEQLTEGDLLGCWRLSPRSKFQETLTKPTSFYQPASRVRHRFRTLSRVWGGVQSSRAAVRDDLGPGSVKKFMNILSTRHFDTQKAFLLSRQCASRELHAFFAASMLPTSPCECVKPVGRS
jgi:hypothetical protein